MEFTKDINFDADPTAEKDTKITYSGYLFKNGSNNVNIVYGFGEDWKDTSSKPMEKEETGFVANIRIQNFDTFNFCFSDENNNWDNNNGFNYISPILPPIPDEEDEEQIDFGTNYASSIDEIIDNILINTKKQNFESSKNEDSVDKIVESINGDALPEIEALFNDLFFESVKEDSTTTAAPEISMEPSLAEELEEVGKVIEQSSIAPVQNAQLSAEDDDSSILEQIDELFTPLINKNETDESIQDNYDETEDLIKQFNELFESSDEPIYFSTTDSDEETESSLFDELDSSISKTENIEETIKEAPVQEAKLDVASFNLDNLVSNILEPVVNSSVESKTEETSLFEDVKSHEDDNISSLALINSGNFTVSSRRPSYFYKLRKRIKLAFIKLERLKDNFVKQLGL